VTVAFIVAAGIVWTVAIVASFLLATWSIRDLLEQRSNTPPLPPDQAD
jgi:hypothetical protein